MQKEKKDALWIFHHEELRDLLKKEISLMRELLTNMHEEERSLLFHDESLLKYTLETRSYLAKQIGEVHQKRLKKTKEIETITTDYALTAPPGEDVSTEMSSLKDQLTALTEQVNRQQDANQHLMDHPNALPPDVQVTVKNKKKISITTK